MQSRIAVPVVGILRGIEAGFFAEVMHASFAAGLDAIEVTMNTPGAAAMIAALRDRVPTGKTLGMGTIRNLDEAKLARDAGAMFFVTPNFDPLVVAFARQHEIPLVCGALTPSEVYAAWRAGVDLVKVFPCGSMGGARYIRELRGPFDHIPMMAVGGVTLENCGEYYAAGAVAVGVSSSLFGRDALAEKNIETLAANVEHFVSRCRSEWNKAGTLSVGK